MTDVKNHMPETAEDSVDFGRRRALARLGLTAAAAYVAPTLLPLTQAAASPSSGGGGSGGGGSHSGGGPSHGGGGTLIKGDSNSASRLPTVATEPSDSSR